MWLVANRHTKSVASLLLFCIPFYFDINYWILFGIIVIYALRIKSALVHYCGSADSRFYVI